MVFDWFRRQSAPQPVAAPAPSAAEAESAAPTTAAPAQDERPAGDSSTTATSTPEPSEGGSSASQESTGSASEVAEAGSASAAPAPAPSAPAQAGTPAAPVVDQDALAWAREAYARLKAQQDAARQKEPPAELQAVAAEQGSGALPSAAPPAQEEPAPAPEVAAAVPPEPQPEARPQAPAPPAGAAAPPTAPAAPAPALSLLEQAAAQRRERQQELLERPEPQSATATAASTGAPAADTAAPQLGAFDEAFTWSVEVLAAQGVRADQVSLEEIDWLGRLRRGLEKTRQGFVSQMLETLGDDPLTPEVLEQLETLLLRADVGVKATDQVLEALRQRLNQEVVDPGEGLRFLKEQLRGVLEAPIQASGTALLAPQRDRLNVWLLVGVNGVGKTTTLGKLANLAVRSGYSCLIAAADTFRAAAVQQVTVWGERSGVPVIANPSANADPAAVVFDAIGAASAKGTELVLVDTAGRLQTKHNLMEELSKVRRIVDRLAPQASVESLLVLDASQGQNGLRQAMAFASAAGLTGVVLTKLDGSSRGGVALAVASEAGLPIRFVGAGEGIRDLRPFNSFEFVEALLAV
ncbi:MULTISPECIES: signal recognition particle-docking protein FtsY [Synechococcales]|uniref:signal recognition particle-docking protein FtsY n=1 Tax=Synechococcus sp. CS-1333 TaxID=2848638 RepID=UPI00223B65F4|nr:signal recognition particle-docking protein FtsY [Synechococcus sp. CS-1333]MCT0209534.1 signal recognition particle-docking protein FtsY [Synechococcus sp. CS-1333]